MAKNPGVARILNALTVRKNDGTEVVVNRNSKLVIQDAKGREKERYSLAYGSTLKVVDGEEVKPGQLLVNWDPFASPILSEIAGKVVFKDIIDGENLREETDKVTGLSQKIVVETTGTTEKRAPQLVVLGVDGTERRYALPIPSHLMVSRRRHGHPGRRARQEAGREEAHPRHRRRPSARRRALRGAPPEGARGHHRGLGRRPARRDGQGAAEARRRVRGRAEARDPRAARRARHGPGRRARRGRATP